MATLTLHARPGTLADVPFITALSHLAYQGQDIAIPEAIKQAWYACNPVGSTVVEGHTGRQKIRLGIWEYLPLNPVGLDFLNKAGTANSHGGGEFREWDLRPEHLWLPVQAPAPSAIYFENLVVLGDHLIHRTEAGSTAADPLVGSWAEEIAAAIKINSVPATRRAVLHQGFAGCLSSLEKIFTLGGGIHNTPIFAMPVARSTELLICELDPAGNVVPGVEVLHEAHGHPILRGRLSLFMARARRIMGRARNPLDLP